MNEKIGIPYMGSKRKLASDILAHIIPRHENITDFYDLFEGGGSVSFTAIRDYRFNVHYNELNSHIYKLVEYLKNNKTLEPKFYEWVTREEFFNQINTPNELATWYSGFVMSCWSFGNSQNSYLYGKEIEGIKKLAHDFIVFGCLDSMREIGVDITQLLNIDDIQKRRILFCDYVKTTNKERFDIQNLERMVQLERIQNLQNLQNPQNLQNLQIYNESYENVEIKGENPIIYCDIPYIGTGEYKEGGFNHKRFYEWANDINYPVYISEYTAPFNEIHAFKHRSSLSSTNNKKQTIEKIFWNGKGEIIKNTLF